MEPNSSVAYRPFQRGDPVEAKPHAWGAESDPFCAIVLESSLNGKPLVAAFSGCSTSGKLDTHCPEFGPDACFDARRRVAFPANHDSQNLPAVSSVVASKRLCTEDCTKANVKAALPISIVAQRWHAQLQPWK